MQEQNSCLCVNTADSGAMRQIKGTQNVPESSACFTLAVVLRATLLPSRSLTRGSSPKGMSCHAPSSTAFAQSTQRYNMYRQHCSHWQHAIWNVLLLRNNNKAAQILAVNKLKTALTAADKQPSNPEGQETEAYDAKQTLFRLLICSSRNGPCLQLQETRAMERQQTRVTLGKSVWQILTWLHGLQCI